MPSAKDMIIGTSLVHLKQLGDGLPQKERAFIEPIPVERAVKLAGSALRTAAKFHAMLSMNKQAKPLVEKLLAWYPQGGKETLASWGDGEKADMGDGATLDEEGEQGIWAPTYHIIPLRIDQRISYVSHDVAHTCLINCLQLCHFLAGACRVFWGEADMPSGFEEDEHSLNPEVDEAEEQEASLRDVLTTVEAPLSWNIITLSRDIEEFISAVGSIWKMYIVCSHALLSRFTHVSARPRHPSKHPRSYLPRCQERAKQEARISALSEQLPGDGTPEEEAGEASESEAEQRPSQEDPAQAGPDEPNPQPPEVDIAWWDPRHEEA